MGTKCRDDRVVVRKNVSIEQVNMEIKLVKKKILSLVF